MSGTITKPRKRLTREESQAQTRATLITVGRAHFLRYGLGGCRCGEDCRGRRLFTRCALFQLRRQGGPVPRRNPRRTGSPNGILSLYVQRRAFSQRTLKKMRDAIADLVTEPDWIVLRAEFEAGALRNERIRRTFVEVHRQQVRDGGNLSGTSHDRPRFIWV